MFVYFSFFTINMYSINIWLVVYLPLWKIWVKVSWDDNKNNVQDLPNHQSGTNMTNMY